MLYQAKVHLEIHLFIYKSIKIICIQICSFIHQSIRCICMYGYMLINIIYLCVSIFIGAVSSRNASRIRLVTSINTHKSQVYIYVYMCIYVQPIPLGVTFSNAVSKIKAHSSNASFATFQWKEPFEHWALSFELWKSF